MASWLLVDGDRNFRRSLTVALSLDGLQVIGAESADEALAWLGRHPFEIAVVDCLLPGADALLAKLMARRVRTLATGIYPEILRGAAGRHPGVATLEKPFRASELRACLAGG